MTVSFLSPFLVFVIFACVQFGEPVNAADYRSDRTTDALMEFAKRKLELESQYKQWPEVSLQLLIFLFFLPPLDTIVDSEKYGGMYSCAYTLKEGLHICRKNKLARFSFPSSFQAFPALPNMVIQARKAHATNWNPDHPGCMLVGHLLVNRVPGNFHVEVSAHAHSFAKHARLFWLSCDRKDQR